MSGCSRPATADGGRVKIGSAIWHVDLATTNLQRYRGLAGRRFLPDDVGMLFIYPDSDVRSYCMRGCRVPLDIAFIDSNLTITTIYTMPVEPAGAILRGYDSDGAAQYVLEVAAGAFERKGVTVGDKVILLGDIPPAAKAQPGP